MIEECSVQKHGVESGFTMIKQTITVEDIMTMDLIKSTGSWKNARKMLKRLFDICLEQGFLQSWEFSTKKKIDSYRSLHRAKIHLYYANAYSAARFPENLRRALAVLDEEMYTKASGRLLDYVDEQKLRQTAQEQNLEAAKDLASEILNSMVDTGLLLDWDVENEPESLDELLDLEISLVFADEEQKQAFFQLDPAAHAAAEHEEKAKEAEDTLQESES